MIRTTLVVEDAGTTRVVDLDIPPDACFGEVCDAVGLTESVWIDGRAVAPGTRCGDLAWPRGALLASSPEGCRCGLDHAHGLEWITGPDVGLPADGAADTSTAFVRIGAHWAVRRGLPPAWSTAQVPAGRATTTINRGLSRPTPRPPTPIDLPRPADPPPPPERPGWASLVLPLVIGLVLAVAVAPMLALFALLSPTMALASWIDQRWQRRRHARDAAARWQHDVQRFRQDLRHARRQALRHAWAGVALPADLLRALVSGSARLWQTALPVDVMVGAGVGMLDLLVDGEDLDAVRADTTAVLPITIRLQPDAVVGVCGPARVDCAQAIVLSAAALTGPADLAIDAPWSWTRWLPHADSGAGTTLVVTQTHPNDTQARRCVIVLAPELEDLPPEVTTVVVATATRVEVVPATGTATHGSPVLTDRTRAEDVARHAARWSDPRAATPATSGQALLDLDLAAPPSAAAPMLLGVGAEGPVIIDLATHGPHVLVAGTTGSGKSELLRTMVATAAAALPPDRLTFFLLDFKGGATFDPVAGLPHVVGVVTDLDGTDAARTLRILRAEVTRRERVLRDRGVADVAALPEPSTMPRFVVVADEVAALLTAEPDAAEILTDLAQRGRSLGVHLVLATQRPRGVIGDALRANLALRICLRTEFDDDAVDVVGVRLPATFDHRSPGRALVAGSTSALIQVPNGSCRRSGQVVIRAVDGVPVPDDHDGPTDLDRLVEACRDRWGDHRPPMAVPGPLPDVLDVEALPDVADGIPIGLLDRPDDLQVDPLVWDATGHLLLHARDPQTTAAALTTVAVQVAARRPSQVHLYGIATGGADLSALVPLPHLGAVVDATDRSALWRLVRRLERPQVPTTMLIVPAWDHLDRMLDDAPGFRLREQLHALVEHGPSNGLVLVAGTARPGAISPAILAGATLRLVGALGDHSDHLLLGRREPPPNRIGRMYVVGLGADVQLATVPDVTGAVADRRRRWLGHPGGPEPLAATPRPWQADDLPAARRDGTRLAVPVGRRMLDGEAATVPVIGGEHVLVAGPRGSGRTSFLQTFQRRAAPLVDVTVVTPSPAQWPIPTLHPDDLPDGPPTRLVLVDDADLVPAGTPLDRWVDDPSVSIVAAQTSSRLRATVTPWLLRVRLGRTGVLLAPVADRDAMHLDAAATSPMPTETGSALLVVDGRADTIAIPAVSPDAAPAEGAPAQTIAAEDTVGFARTKSTIRWT